MDYAVISFFRQVVPKEMERRVYEFVEMRLRITRMRFRQPIIDSELRVGMWTAGHVSFLHLGLEDPREEFFDVIGLKWREPFEETSLNRYIRYCYLFLLTCDNQSPYLSNWYLSVLLSLTSIRCRYLAFLYMTSMTFGSWFPWLLLRYSLYSSSFSSVMFTV